MGRLELRELLAILHSPAEDRPPELLDRSLRDVVGEDKVLRYLLLLELSRLADVPEELIAEISTFGELASWVDHFRNSPPPEEDLSTQWPLETSSLRIRPPSPPDFSAIAGALSDPRRAHRMPNRGMTVSASTVAENVFGPMTALAVVVETNTPDPELELLATFDSMAPANRRVNVNVFSLVSDRSQRTRRPLGIEAAAMSISYAFDVLPIEKICGDIPEWNYEQFQAGEGLYFVLEGVRERHEWLGGTAHRLFEIAIFREQWDPAIRTSIAALNTARG